MNQMSGLYVTPGHQNNISNSKIGLEIGILGKEIVKEIPRTQESKITCLNPAT